MGPFSFVTLALLGVGSLGFLGFDEFFDEFFFDEFFDEILHEIF